MKRYFFFFFASLVLVASDGAVDYLNALRLSAGVQPVAIDDALTLAAQHHSEYMQMHHVVSHVEEKGKEGFFGKTPRQRAHNAGRFSLRISETISVGDVSGTASIDRLMAAIYHRLVMLDPMIDRIGMGQRALFYTYDMGVSAIEDACAHGDGASNKGLALCGNGTFVNADRYRTIVQQAYGRIPDMVVWPADRQADIPPVFYDETPDPLPNVSVSGYPLSVVLNQTRFQSPVTLMHFALHDAQGNTVAMLTEMNATNDPHHLLLTDQFVFFPRDRLEWGMRYDAEVSFRLSDGTVIDKTWCFAVRSLRQRAQRYYRIATKEAHITVRPDTDYAIYMVPLHVNDRAVGFSRSYGIDRVNVDPIDFDTYRFRFHGDIGQEEVLRFDNGRVVRVTIAKEDQTQPPLALQCEGNADFDLEGRKDVAPSQLVSNDYPVLSGVDHVVSDGGETTALYRLKDGVWRRVARIVTPTWHIDTQGDTITIRRFDDQKWLTVMRVEDSAMKVRYDDETVVVGTVDTDMPYFTIDRNGRITPHIQGSHLAQVPLPKGSEVTISASEITIRLPLQQAWHMTQGSV